MLKNIDGSGGGGKVPGAELGASTCLVEHLHPRVAQKHRRVCFTNYYPMARLQWWLRQNSKYHRVTIPYVNKSTKNKMENKRIPMFTIDFTNAEVGRSS